MRRLIRCHANLKTKPVNCLTEWTWSVTRWSCAAASHHVSRVYSANLFPSNILLVKSDLRSQKPTWGLSVTSPPAETVGAAACTQHWVGHFVFSVGELVLQLRFVEGTLMKLDVTWNQICCKTSRLMRFPVLMCWHSAAVRAPSSGSRVGQ